MVKTDDGVREAVEAVFRIERPKLIGGLSRRVRDVGLAEDLAQEALLAALTTWPRTGVPSSPGAWLMTAAKRRAVTDYRRVAMMARKSALLEPNAGATNDDPTSALDAALDDEVGDDVLGLIFTVCHPTLPAEQAAALTLRLVAGLTIQEIARAYRVREGAVAQRIVRAKRTLGLAGVSFEIPAGPERAERSVAVLEIVYLIFSEGYFATSGASVTRPVLCRKAQRLGRILAGLAPEEPPVLGLLALMDLQASRLAADQEVRRADPAAGSGSNPVGPSPHPPRLARPGARIFPGRVR